MTGFQAPRGLRDLVGEQAAIHAAIESAAYAAAESAGSPAARAHPDAARPRTGSGRPPVKIPG